MTRCTHRDSLGRWTTGIVYGTIYEPDPITIKPIGYRCAKCGGLCALGEAAEDTTETDIELRAALWVADDFVPFTCDNDCCCGGCQSRRLANVIAQHAEGE